MYFQPVDRDQDQDTASFSVPEFHCNHGKNIMLSNSNLTIERVASYNQAIAVTNKPLARNRLFQVSTYKSGLFKIAVTQEYSACYLFS